MPGNKGLKILIACAFTAAGILFAHRLFPIFLPFALGAALAKGAEPTVSLLTRKCHLPRWAAAGTGVTLFFLLTVGIFMLLTSFLVRQLGRLSGLLPQLADAVSAGLSALEDWLTGLAQRLPPSMTQFTQRCVESLFSDSSAMLEQAVSRVPQVATGLMGTLGQWALVLFTAVLSGYMISARLPILRGWIRKKAPRLWQQYLPALKDMRKAAGRWLLAQGKLMGLTFLLLTAGLFLLKADNPLLLSALITLVDAFPILGTGTVLIPWSVVCLLQGNYARGIGLVGLYVVVWLTRSVLEPKIIGKELGLDPLVTLFSIYAGFCLLGIGGMLIAPIAAMLVTQLIKHRVQ